MRKNMIWGVINTASLLVLSLVAANSGSAAEIEWNPAFEIETDADVDVSREIVRAVNVASPDEVDFIEVIFPGDVTVEFEPEHTFEFNADLDEFFFSGGNVTGQGTFYSGQDALLTTENFDLDLILDSHGWAGGGPANAAAVLELDELEVGQTYQLQLIGAADDRGCCEFRQMEIWDIDGEAVSDVNGDELWFGRSNDFDQDDERGPGSLIGTFTADEETQSVFLVGTDFFDDGNGGLGNGNDPGLSAYILSLADGGGVPGDVNGDGVVDGGDIDAVAEAVRTGATDATFDLDGDGSVSDADRVFLVKDASLLNTWIGDSNLDLEFSSNDFVQVFQRGQYEDAQDGNSGWADGDWNGDADFDSSDFVVAFQDGGFERGPRAAVSSVPEPSSLVLALLAVAGLVGRRRRY